MRVVAVVYGGTSREHEVSVLSGREVLRHIDRERFRPLDVLIGKDATWTIDGRCVGGALEGAAALRRRGCEACFLALHGRFGEGGTLQGFLETVGLPYTGSGVAGSALALDKIRAKRVLAAHGVPTAPDLTVPPADAAEVAATLGFPAVVKDPHEGSTLGLHIVHDEQELEGALRRMRCPTKLVEAYVRGRELTAAILEDERGRPVCLPLIEIVAKNGFFDYQEKYGAQGARKLLPAPIAAREAAALEAAALTAHRALGLEGMSRSDFLLRPDGRFVYLETNSIPGLTPSSLLPKAAAAAGIGFRELITRLIERALGSAAGEAGADGGGEQRRAGEGVGAPAHLDRGSTGE